MTGKLGDAGTKFENAKLNMFAVDLNLVENINPFQLNIKGRYNVIDITQSDYINPTNSSNYNFSNRTKTGYVMMALRPVLSSNSFSKSCEMHGMAIIQRLKIL